VGDSNSVVRVGAGDVLVAGSASVIPISITRLSRPLAVGVVDVVAIGSMVVRTALVDERVAAAIAISRLSRPLAISITSIAAIAIASQTLGASVDRAGTTVWMVGNSAVAISRLSLSVPLAIVATVSITTIAITAIVSRESLGRSVGVASGITITRLSLSVPLSIVAAMSITTIAIAAIVSRKTLGRSVGVAGGMAISRLGLSVPLAIAIDVVAIVIVGRAVAIAMVSLRHIHGGRSIAAIAISRLSLSVPLAIIAIAVTAMESLGRSVGVAHPGVGVVGSAIAIARLGSRKAGEGEDDRKRFNCHGC